MAHQEGDRVSYIMVSLVFQVGDSEKFPKAPGFSFFFVSVGRVHVSCPNSREGTTLSSW